MSLNPPTIDDILRAADRIAGHIHRTPVFTSCGINSLAGAEIYFKCENLQKTGSFKIRGATNAVLSTARANSFATHSSGNHAAALALASKRAGAEAHIVMPETSSRVKREAVAGYGANIYYCRPTLRARERMLEEVVEKTEATFVHPYDNPAVIAGQGTAALELLEQVEDLDTVITPVGGGGLLAGTAISVTSVAPSVSVFAAEPAGADDAYRSFNSGRLVPSENPDTIADGLLTSLSDLTFGIIRRSVSGIIRVSEESIVSAMRLVWERMKLVIEPSAAVGLGALIESRNEIPGERVGVILSGGNVDLKSLPF